MIYVEAYRARIGTLKIDRNYYPSSFRTNEDTTHFLHTFFLVILILDLNLNFALLLLDGDVESNPGPTTYTLLKVVQGSFPQGDPKFGQTAGIQCVCNSLFSLWLCWSPIKRVTVWTTYDLDYVLEKVTINCIKV